MKAAKVKQLKFKGVAGWGGRRQGAGRPNLSRQVGHGRRLQITANRPLHVTLKLRSRRWNLRRREIKREFEASARATKVFGLYVLHFAILRDHIHLIAETRDNEALARGMRSFGSRFGKAIRRVVGGKGPVFLGRFHLKVIRTPTQMRNTYSYVLQNFAKHARLIPHFDEFSSAGNFKKWRELIAPNCAPPADHLVSGRPARGPLPSYLSPPKSWLASEGWLMAARA